jgi:CMP-N-acetylneuraminic acid synthetase
MMKISVFLPCRSGSKRIKDKNVKLFANNPNGLVGIKLDQLLRIKYLDKLYLSTNDEKIIQYANTLNNQKIVIDKREEYLCSDETSTDELIDYVGSLIKSEHVLWTHVTSPLFGTKEYEFVIEKYFEVNNSGYDSLMTVTPIREFLWTKNGAKKL